MLKGRFYLLLILSLGMTACGGSSGDDNNEDGANLQEVNVATSANGATARSAFNSASAANLIDEDLSTTWISEPDTPIVVEFSEAERIIKIELDFVSADVSYGTGPDIFVEISLDGINYDASGVTALLADIPCTESNFANDSARCTMEARKIKFIQITSKVGKSFEFKELRVFANKEVEN